MDLKEANKHNLAFMINDLADHLNVINRAILEPSHYDLTQYNQIKSIYNMVMTKKQLTVSEIQAILEELSKYRKK